MRVLNSKIGDVLVVIPAFNEQESIREVLLELQEFVKLENILVIDDGSSDETGSLARKLGVHVLTLPFNLGVGGAVRTGFLYAYRNDYSAVVQFDADGQHDPRYLQRLVNALSESDVAIGSRFSGLGSYKTFGPRRWAMRFLAAVLSAITRTRLNDVTSGFRATGPRALALFSNNYPVEYLGDTVESILLGHKSGLKFSQIPVEMRYRVTGKPSQSLLQATLFLARAIVVLLLGILRPKENFKEAKVFK